MIAKIALALAALGIVWLLLDATTPAECKVPTEQMSAACLRMVQP